MDIELKFGGRARTLSRQGVESRLRTLKASKNFWCPWWAPYGQSKHELLANTWYNVDKQNGLQSRGKMA